MFKKIVNLVGTAEQPDQVTDLSVKFPYRLFMMSTSRWLWRAWFVLFLAFFLTCLVLPAGNVLASSNEWTGIAVAILGVFVLVPFLMVNLVQTACVVSRARKRRKIHAGITLLTAMGIVKKRDDRYVVSKWLTAIVAIDFLVICRMVVALI